MRFIDLDGRVGRDANGKIVWIAVGKPEIHIYAGDANKKTTMQLGYMMSNDGKSLIPAYKNLSEDKSFDTNCHGTTFADGEFWVNNNAVERLFYLEMDIKRKGIMIKKQMKEMLWFLMMI